MSSSSSSSRLRAEAAKFCPKVDCPFKVWREVIIPCRCATYSSRAARIAWQLLTGLRSGKSGVMYAGKSAWISTANWSWRSVHSALNRIQETGLTFARVGISCWVIFGNVVRVVVVMMMVSGRVRPHSACRQVGVRCARVSLRYTQCNRERASRRGCSRCGGQECTTSAADIAVFARCT